MECPSADMPEPSIQAYDVEKPVLDFTVVSGAVPSIWISADSSWPYVGGAISTDSVHVAEVSNGKVGNNKALDMSHTNCFYPDDNVGARRGQGCIVDIQYGMRHCR